MGIFSGRHFPRDIILWAVRWYCHYGVSYRALEEMMTDRGVPVDHTTIPDWQASSWRVDETYIRVGGRWCYLYRAITAGGQTLDFYLSPKSSIRVGIFLDDASIGSSFRFGGERRVAVTQPCRDRR